MINPTTTIEAIWPESPATYPMTPSWKHGFRGHWLYAHEKLAYEKNLQMGIITPYGETDVTYTYNRHGFRCMEFDDIPKDAFRVVTLGCSYTEGEAVPVEHTLPHIFCDMLQKSLGGAPVANLNLGVAGSSNQNIALRTKVAVDSLKPNLVIVVWTHSHRRMHFYDNNEYLDWYTPTKMDEVSKDPKIKLKMTYFERFQNRYDDLNSLMTNVYFVDSLCRAESIPHLQYFHWTEFEDRDFIRRRYLPGVYEYRRGDRKARDNNHHGVAHNTWMAEQLFNAYAML